MLIGVITDHSAAVQAGTLRDTADRDPFPFYDRLRARASVSWDESVGAWLVSSYEACKQLERNEDLLFRHADLHMDGGTYIALEGGPRNIIFLTGEQHAALHRLLMRMLAPSVVDAWRAALIRPLLEDLFAAF